MGRHKRIYYSNATYHVTIRGNNRQMVLEDEKDKIEFLKILDKFKERSQFKLYGLMLMDISKPS